jgi:acetolactate synthase-1/2/3 large subunit
MGDGGMLFAIGELATVAQERLPLTVVVVDDGGYGMLRHPHDSASGCELSPVDFVQVATGFGVAAESVEGVGREYERALARALASREPRLLHVRARLYPPRTTSPRWPMK